MFRKLSVLAIIFLFVIQSFASQTADEWSKLVPSDKSCSILMPSVPERSQETKDTSYGPLVTQIWLTKIPNGIYLLGITDYPIDIDAKKELDLDRDNFLKEVKAKLVSETEIKLGGIPGKEFTGVSDSYTFKSRVYVVGRRAYQIVAGEQTESLDEMRVTKFLQSFEFGKNPQPKNDDPVVAPIIPRKSKPN